MNRETFLNALRVRLRALPEAERERCVEDYRGMILDRMEDGASEAEAIAELGSPEEIAGQILEEVPLTTLVKERIRPKRSLRGWEIALLILGVPVWLPLLLAAFTVALSLTAAVFAVLFAVFATGLAALVSSVPVAIYGTGDTLLLVGVVLTLVSLGTLLGIAGWKLGVRFAKGIFHLIRNVFLKNAEKKEAEVLP